MRETASMHLRRFFYSRIAKEKKRENTSENNSESSIWDNFSCHFSLCNLDGSGKVLKLLCGAWKEVIFKMQNIVQTTSSLVL